jgi:hypothetical protein
MYRVPHVATARVTLEGEEIDVFYGLLSGTEH